MQRWAGGEKWSTGDMVKYADHVEALRQAEQRGYDRGVMDIADMAMPAIALSIKRDTLAGAEGRGNDWWAGYAQGMASGIEQGQRDAIEGAVQRVEALIHADCHEDPCDWCAQLEAVIAAIRGES